MFEPGAKVVCVDDKFPRGIEEFYDRLPVKNETYTVRDIVPGHTFECKETATVYLEELINTPNLHNIEPGFQCCRFVEPEEVELYEELAVRQGEGILV